MESKGSCLGRVPFSSLIGFVLIFVGGGVLCGTLFHGISQVDDYFTLHFFPIYSLRYLRVAAVVHGGIAILLGFLIVIFSALVTNATRGRIYRGDRFTMGGRFSAALFMCITYTAIAVWLLFLGFLVVPTFCWIMFNSVCTNELAHVWHGPGARRPGPDGRVAPSLEELRERNELIDDTYTARLAYYFPDPEELRYFPSNLPQPAIPGFPLVNHQGRPYSREVYARNRLYGYEFTYIFNLTNYGVYIKPWRYDQNLNYREAITTVEGFAEFCDVISIIGPLFACSLGGALFVVLGLILLVGALSGFYTRLKLTKELTDFKQSIALRSPKAHDQTAYF
ncbi:unnamed protein product [Calicophoron daubneyi]|uniref:Myelin proteolipid n=1 Tax=Calicophoron daubneyi TaxID=300641 RepID=A0AAV2THH6_CALDB